MGFRGYKRSTDLETFDNNFFQDGAFIWRYHLVVVSEVLRHQLSPEWKDRS
ncbi:hypothetical protein HMPREF9946_00517 [Acetobacteraceae bacterium AT-5844]|nr:hypothetical protein HMPREF9946_00517 [Acetobacteraceae bacterium AT-5844]